MTSPSFRPTYLATEPHNGKKNWDRAFEFKSSTVNPPSTFPASIIISTSKYWAIIGYFITVLANGTANVWGYVDSSPVGGQRNVYGIQMENSKVTYVCTKVTSGSRFRLSFDASWRDRYNTDTTNYKCPGISVLVYDQKDTTNILGVLTISTSDLKAFTAYTKSWKSVALDFTAPMSERICLEFKNSGTGVTGQDSTFFLARIALSAI